MNAKTIEGYDLWYRLEERSFCFKRLVAPPEGAFPRKRRHNAWSDPFLWNLLFPERIQVRLVDWYSSGHMDDPQDAGVVATADASRASELVPLLGRDEVDRIAAVYAHPDGWAMSDRPRWLREALGSFNPMTATDPNSVKPASADFLEIGRCAGGDGRVPYLIFRLGRAHDEVVRDHGSTRDARNVEVLERFDPPATAEASAAIERRFGAHIAEVATWFAAAGRWRVFER